MPLDIKAEIAHRLEIDEQELEPVLYTVVQRIRQQVAHYGYARLAGLGTFRGRTGEIVFEPDPVLAETVNLRFAGLEPIRVESPAEETTAAPVASQWDERDLPEAHTLSEFEDEIEEAPYEGALAPEDQLEDVAAAADEEDFDEPPAAPVEDQFEEEVPAAQHEEAGEEEDVWRDQEEEEHPLGPVPTPAYEDAEFSVIGEQDDDEGPLPELDFEDEDAEEASGEEIEDESHLESAAMWAALGASTEETDEDHAPEEMPEAVPSPAHAEAAETGGDVDEVGGERDEVGGGADEVGAEPNGERGEAGGRPGRGPDRAARPHEAAQRDWPSERTPSGLDRQASRRNTILVGAGVIVLVAAAAIAYFALQPAEVTGPDTTARTEQPAEPAGDADESPSGATTAEGDDPADERGETPADAAAGAGDGPATPPSEPAVESTPLRSPDGIDPAAGGFTIVVFSETDQGPAAEVVQRYRGEGFRSDVLSSQEGGVTRYRVAVGQFETLEEAVDARNQLAGNDLPQDAWVHRLE